MHDDGLVPVPGPAALGYDRKSKAFRWSTFPLALPRILRELLYWEPDRSLAEWSLPRLDTMFGFFAGYEDARGLLVIDPLGKQHLEPFVGWNPSQRNGVECGSNALYLAALQDGAEAASIAGNRDIATKWEAKAKRLRQSIVDAFWIPERALFANGEKEGRRVDFVSSTVNAWCALTGCLPAGAIGSWSRAVTKNSMILPLASPYDASVLLMAVAHLDVDDGVRNLLEGYYGSIIRANEPYFPEYWQEHGRTSITKSDDSSHCHPFGSGPAFVLHDYVLGVKPMKAGWNHIHVEPHHAGLWQASGRIPTPLGDITVAWERTDTSWELEVEIPKGMTADIRLPRFGTEHQELRVGGEVVATADYWSDYEPLANQRATTGRITYLQCKISAGRHQIQTTTC